MMHLLVTVKKLNRRSGPPNTLSDQNITGTVLRGYRFTGEEVVNVPNPALGKWYRDEAGGYYWGGGLMIESVSPAAKPASINGLPAQLPADYQIGIDLSHHNQIADWSALKSPHIHFCFIKISEGVGTRDSMAKVYTEAARRNGLKVGYYHFCRPDTKHGGTVIKDAAAEAEEALAIMAGLGTPDLPLVLDLEDEPGWDTPLKPQDYLKWINTFIARVKESSGMDTIIYSRKEYLDRKLPGSHDLGNIRLWIADYTQRDYRAVRCPAGWKDWAIWQCSEKAVIGSNGSLDMNILKDPHLF